MHVPVILMVEGHHSAFSTPQEMKNKSVNIFHFNFCVVV